MSSSSEPSTVDRVTQELRDRIRRGLLVGGQRLIEADWTSALNVSRGPVREAFGRLVVEGLLVVEPKRGAVVRQLGEKEIADLYEARTAIEGRAAAAAARAVDAGDNRARVEEALREHQHFLDGGEFGHYLGVNERFHYLVLDIADNGMLRRLGEQLLVLAYHLQTTRVAQATAPLPLLTVAGSAQRHCDIMEAILAGDAAEAERLMCTHLALTRDGILEADRLHKRS